MEQNLLPSNQIPKFPTTAKTKDAVVAFGFCLLLYSGRLPLAIGYGLPISSMPARKLAWESSPLSGLFYWCLPLLAVIPMPSDATQASPMPTGTVAAETPQPTKIPTEAPASEPPAVPTEVPTPEPTVAPTETPTPQPTEVPATESISSTTSTNSSVYQAGMVYIASSGNGKKYHRIPSCSGMDNATAVTLEQAEAWGYTPCKRCY